MYDSKGTLMSQQDVQRCTKRCGIALALSHTPQYKENQVVTRKQEWTHPADDDNWISVLQRGI